jgi:hypothetical protein
VLALVLTQRRSYVEIAGTLRLEHDAVRVRAQAAVDALVPGRGPRRGGRIVDYLLGQQDAATAARTRRLLGRSRSGRRWALAAAAAIAPLAAGPLPEIPAVERRRPPRSVALAGAGVAAALGVLAIVLATSGGGAKHAAKRQPRLSRQAPGLSGAGTAGRPAATTPVPPSLDPRGLPAGAKVAQIPLTATPAARGAVGRGTVIKEAGTLVLVIQAAGLAPNAADAYAVWLTGSPAGSRLIGFVSPAVGADGRFTSGTDLPPNAASFRGLRVTRETAAKPLKPGQAVLEGTLRLKKPVAPPGVRP